MLRQEAGGNSNVIIYGHVLFDKLNYAWKRIFYLILLKNLKAFYSTSSESRLSGSFTLKISVVKPADQNGVRFFFLNLVFTKVRIHFM